MIKLFLTFLILAGTTFASERIIITGSSTIAPVLSDLAKQYEKRNENIRIDVQTGGSSRGIADTRKNIAHIGMVSRALKSNESDLISHTFASDGLSLIVHKSNPVKNLSAKQIADIYQGKIRNWSELGGDDGKIVVVNKASGRSTLELFLKFFKLKNSQIRADIIIGDNEQGIKTISTNPLAIGYISIGAAEYNASIGVKIKPLSFEGVKASVQNIENGSYPLKRQLNLITLGTNQKNVKSFLSFVLSKKSSEIIKDHFLVPNH